MSQNLSGNYLDYMDGVPVKISEKYKPPPIITLPYGIIESTSRAAEIIESINYDFNLENNVLKKLVEWQNARETEKNERNHRLQLLEEARQRELDRKAAAENEERLKQLSISEVSYPSTEEISEISPDDIEDKPPEISLTVPSTQHLGDQNSHISQQITISEGHTDIPENAIPYGNCISNIYSYNKYLENAKSEAADILKPTPVSPQRVCAPTNLLDDPDPIQQFQQSLCNQSQQKLSYIRPSFMKNNVDNLTFSDFENDTSSPFDNMELKTINDLELLAQVLNSNPTVIDHVNPQDNLQLQQIKQPSVHQPNNGLISAQTYSNVHSKNPDIYSPDAGYACTQDPNHAMLPYSYNSASAGMSNGYYNDASSKLPSYAHTGVANVGNYYAPDYGYNISNSMYQHLPNISGYSQNNDNIYSHNNQSDQNIGNDTYQRKTVNTFNQPVNNPYDYYNASYSYYPTPTFTAYSPPVNAAFIPSAEPQEETPVARKMIGSRSRSVPDIVRELDEEVAEARQRARERSHNCSPALQPTPGRALLGSPPPSKAPLGSPPPEELPDPFSSLPADQQSMCRHISSMGFPLQRVARASDKLGVDDKKIVEYLLVMGQLMDLGFPESNISEALLKNNCNRDKALDDLIS